MKFSFRAGKVAVPFQSVALLPYKTFCSILLHIRGFTVTIEKFSITTVLHVSWYEKTLKIKFHVHYVLKTENIFKPVKFYEIGPWRVHAHKCLLG